MGSARRPPSAAHSHSKSHTVFKSRHNGCVVVAGILLFRDLLPYLFPPGNPQNAPALNQVIYREFEKEIFIKPIEAWKGMGSIMGGAKDLSWNNYFVTAPQWADSMYSTVFSASVFMTYSNLSASLSSRVILKPGTEVKKDVSGTTQIPVEPKR